MKDEKESSCYLQIDQYFQEKIDAVLAQFKANTTDLSILETGPDKENAVKRTSITERSDTLRKELTEILNAKQQFRKDFNLNNPWLVLFTQIPEDFEITKELSLKLIYQVNVYRDAPLSVIFQEEKAKKLLLSYLALVKTKPETRKEDCYGTKEPSEQTAGANPEL